MTNLKRIRKESGLSQTQLSELSGVSMRMISKYETGEKDINKAQSLTVYKLAEALDVSIENLLEI
jgi:transcriptional regulator with XRE-family HTH domain